MSRVNEKQLRWDAPSATDVTGYRIYAAEISDMATWLAAVDSGNAEADRQATIPAIEEVWVIDLPNEGIWSFAVVAVDDAGNTSDPHQSNAWVEVPLDVTPPDAPSGGVIESVA